MSLPIFETFVFMLNYVLWKNYKHSLFSYFFIPSVNLESLETRLWGGEGVYIWPSPIEIARLYSKIKFIFRYYIIGPLQSFVSFFLIVEWFVKKFRSRSVLSFLKYLHFIWIVMWRKRFFIYYLAASWLTLGHCWGDSHTNSVLTVAFLILV